MKKGWLSSICLVAAVALIAGGTSLAGEKGHGSMTGGTGHGSMPGMHGDNGMEGHGMMKMGDKVFEGEVGAFHGEARLMDMKAQMEKAKTSGMKMEGMGMMKNTHHLSLGLTDPHTKEAVTEGKGSVTITGPDKKQARTDFMVMQGHFGADVNLPAPGEYTFHVEVDAGGKEASATFHHTVQ